MKRSAISANWSNITTMPLDDIDYAFDVVHDGEPIRSVVVYKGAERRVELKKLSTLF